MSGNVRTSALFCIAVLCLSGSGCVVTDIGVSNPLPQVRRVAIAPFINLTPEPDVDLGRRALFGGGYVDRRFAQAYFAELQKTPGFEVIPVGVVDQAIAASGLPMSGPQDYLVVANMVGADAIVVGAVTDFDPYHPRLGMQVQWYSTLAAAPPAPTMPFEREWAEEQYKAPPEPKPWTRGRGQRDAHGAPCADNCEVVRGQSPSEAHLEAAISDAEPVATALPPPAPLSSKPRIPESAHILPAFPQGAMRDPDAAVDMTHAVPAEVPPLYSYTRMFDGRDARLTARLRDYVELSGDMRSGGWEGYLERSDDFIRFSCFIMINEMFMLHGGESSRRTVFKFRKELFRKL